MILLILFHHLTELFVRPKKMGIVVVFEKKLVKEQKIGECWCRPIKNKLNIPTLSLSDFHFCFF